MVPFAGYDMPVQYPLGVMKEHLHTREQAGLFDVSHMGQIRLTGANAAKALETLVPVDIIDLPVGMQRYAMFTNDQGGILDDLMVANLGNDELFLVVNAACKDQDLAHLRAHRRPVHHRAAVRRTRPAGPARPGGRQGAGAPGAGSGQDDLHAVRALRLLGVDCFVSRSGYTGEDGFEISVPAANAEAWPAACWPNGSQAIGLGARDSLRLEAGLCLYGHDMNTDTTPIEASLLWAISKGRRADGARAGGFPGADRIFAQQQTGVAANVSACCRRNAPRCVKARRSSTKRHRDRRQLQRRLWPEPRRPLAMGYLDSAYCTGHPVSAWCVGKGATACKQNAICSTTLLPWLIDCFYK
jgi:aminomethyltransferase